MATDREPTLTDTWTARLKNHPWVAAAIILATVVAGAASFTDSAKKLLEAIGVIQPRPPAPVLVSVPAAPPAPTAPAPQVAQPQADCISAEDASLYEAELKNADSLIQQGESLLRSAPSAVLYEKVKAWEDIVNTELRAYAKNHANTLFDGESSTGKRSIAARTSARTRSSYQFSLNAT